MGTFQNRKYRPTGAAANTFGARYRAIMAKRPFLLFGLPFLSVIVGASFVLTPATAIRYERHDRKVRQMSRDEELGVGKARRKVDIREEYYVGSLPPGSGRLARFLREATTGVVCVWLRGFADALFTETFGQGHRQLGAEASQETGGGE